MLLGYFCAVFFVALVYGQDHTMPVEDTIASVGQWGPLPKIPGARSTACDNPFITSGGLTGVLCGEGLNGVMETVKINTRFGPCSIWCRALGCSLRAMGCAQETIALQDNYVDKCSAADGGPLNCARTLGIGDNLCRTMSSFLRNETRAASNDFLGMGKQALELCADRTAEDASLVQSLITVLTGLFGPGFSNALLTVEQFQGPCADFLCRHAVCALNLVGCHEQVEPIIDFIKSRQSTCPGKVRKNGQPQSTGPLLCAGFTTPPPTPPPCMDYPCPVVENCPPPENPHFQALPHPNNQMTGVSDEERCCLFCQDPPACQMLSCRQDGSEIDDTACAAKSDMTTVPRKIFENVRTADDGYCCKKCQDKCLKAAGTCTTDSSCPDPSLYTFVATDECCSRCVHECDAVQCPAVTENECVGKGQVLYKPCDVVKRNPTTGKDYRPCNKVDGCCPKCVDQYPCEDDGPFSLCGDWYLRPAWIGVFAGIFLLCLLACLCVCLFLFMSKKKRQQRGRARSRGHSMARKRGRTNTGGARRSRSGTRQRAGTGSVYGVVAPADSASETYQSPYSGTATAEFGR